MSENPLIATSLLGAGRLKTLPPAPDPSLQPVWDRISMADPAAAVLEALAMDRAARLAGRKPQDATAESELSPAESAAPLADLAVSALLRMLGGEYREVLPEWLESASESGRILPPRVLPEALEAGRRDRYLRAPLAALTGERGRWMARRHEAFSWVLDESGEADWDADHAADRLAWLKETRRVDPQQAVVALTESWAGESPDFRQAVVQLAADDPLPSDEGWLETLALKDRRQETRRLATAALMQLSNSAFAKRARDRLRGRVRVSGKWLTRNIEVEPPEAFEKAWESDGLSAKPPAGTGEKAWWLQQIVSMVPIAEWPAILEIKEEELFSLAIDSDWRDALLVGWIEGAKSVPALALPGRLIHYLTELKKWPDKAGVRSQVLASLLEADPEPGKSLEAIAKHLPEEEMTRLLISYRRVIPQSTVRAVVRKTLSRKPVAITRPEGRLLALCIPIDAIQSELEWLSRLDELSAPAEEFATTLEFRRSLFSPTP